jgi:hypothetical protein
MVPMEKYFFVQSIFLVVGMMDHLRQMCFHTFVITLDVINFESTKDSQGVVMQLGFFLAL